MSQNYVQSFDKLCDTLLGIGDNIQSISIINRKGRAIEKKTRNGTELVRHQKNEMLLMQCALTMSMGRDFDEDFGEIGHILVQRKNFSTLSVPMDEYIVFVSFKTPSVTGSLVRKAMDAINRYNLDAQKARHHPSKTNSVNLNKEKLDLDPQPSLILAQ